MPSSPNGWKPRPTKTSDAGATWSAVTTMSQSMIGLLASPGTEVLPTCSMATTSTSDRARAAVYSSLSASKRCGHDVS